MLGGMVVKILIFKTDIDSVDYLKFSEQNSLLKFYIDFITQPFSVFCAEAFSVSLLTGEVLSVCFFYFCSSNFAYHNSVVVQIVLYN